jgi:small-conductance mechanosensitive channel
MIIASTVLNRAAETFGAYLPRIGAFLALLIVGYLVAAIFARMATKTLAAVGFDALAERAGITRDLTRAGITRPASRVIGTLVRVAILVVTVVAAISALGLSALNASLNSLVLFLPKLFVAFLLIVLGFAIARFMRERVERSATRMDLTGPLGPITEGAIVAVFVTTALAQLSISLVVLTLIVAIIIAAACAAAAIAFGLGSRDTAGQIAAGRTIANSLKIGQTISIGEHQGEIHAFESAATLLRTHDDVVLRIPNSVLLQSIVTIHGEPE